MQRGDDVLLRLLGKPGINGQTDQPLSHAFGHRQIARPAAVGSLRIRRRMERNEMEARFNARLSKARAQLAKRNKPAIMPLRTDRASTIPCWQTPADR